jgi:hypothetical protein
LAKAAKGRLTAVAKAGLARPVRLVEFLMQRARDELRAMADMFGR